jgi:formylglycine-generating enzyme required for sulfatase activity/pimeloyl-ACP methyl ester carboxylesterase
LKTRAYHGEDTFCFVSYAHHDAAVVYEEIAALNGDGFRLYYDEGIHPGHTWHDELAEAIEKCSLFVIFITPQSVASRNCVRELNFALDKDKPILAVHLEKIELPSGLQLALGDRQAIFSYRYTVDEFRERFSKAVSGYLTPDTEPELAVLKERVKESASESPLAPSRLTKLAPWLTGLFLLILLGAGYQYYLQKQAEDSVYAVALEKISGLVHQDRYSDAFLIAQPLMYAHADDAVLADLWTEMTQEGTLSIEPPGSAVWIRPYRSSGENWLSLGASPLQMTALPRGVLRVRVEKPGFDTGNFVVANPGLLPGNADFGERNWEAGNPISLRIFPTGVVGKGMVPVPALDLPTYLTGWTRSVFGTDTQLPVPEFAVARGEVTNADYKAFVDAGGYQNESYWQDLRFLDRDQELSAEQAMARFVDKTGRPGPATWELSNYDAGESNLPVGGLSWYEAVAYSRYAGMSLPTVHHWVRYAMGPLEVFFMVAPEMVLQSNFLSDGPMPADQEGGLGPWGTYHTAGNVREWVWNEFNGEGLILGDSWSDYAGNYTHVYHTSRMDRQAENGLRLMRQLTDEPLAEQLFKPIEAAFDEEYARREPVSDEAFEAMRFQFTSLNRVPQRIETKLIEESDIWTVEEQQLHYASGYQLTLYLIKPRGVSGPLQPVLLAPPGDSAIHSPNDRILIHARYFDFVVRGGRSLVAPIWTGTYQRALTTRASSPEEGAMRQRLGALSWQQDAVDLVNYLQSREDMDAANTAFLGNSYGASAYGQLVMALEPRIKTGVFVSGGIPLTSGLHPMLDAVNYIPRITQPLLMINGRYDHFFPYELSQQRMLALLGTPEADKKLVVFDAGHFDYPYNQMVAEISDWLDKYLEPVR